MRTLCLAIAVLAACGPSSAELKTAKTAVYQTDAHQLLELAKQAVVDERYKVGESDETQLVFATQDKFFGPEGDLESPGAGGFVQLRPGSVQVSFVVRVIQVDRGFSVEVKPVTFQVVAGSPKPRQLQPDDPYLPPFVLGRADSLSLAIYDHAKQFAVRSP